MFVHELGRRIRSMQLPSGANNCCFEVAAAGVALAHEMGINAEPQVGVWYAPVGEVSPHAWLRIGDIIVHSRMRPTHDTIDLEALPASDAFEPCEPAEPLVNNKRLSMGSGNT
jgi:Transglutaminase-like superfamily